MPSAMRARRIEVEIRYDGRELRVRVRDDSIGMEASVLDEGRAGHYGLPGIRERAKRIGARGMAVAAASKLGQAGAGRVANPRAGYHPAPTLLCILLAWCASASALNPALEINQYAHTPWRVRDGFAKGYISSIAQTPDGYLWFGTEFGLLRFDGARNVSWSPPGDARLPSNVIGSLLATRDGALWIGTDQGLASWKDGKLKRYPALDGKAVFALLQDREGTLWAGAWALPTGRVCAIRSGSVHCYGEDGSLGQWVESLYEDRGGSLWSGGETGVWRWKPGPPARYRLPLQVASPQALIESGDGGLLIAVRGGIRRLVDGKVEAYPLAGAGRQFTPRSLLRDRDGGLWVGTLDRGLLHVHEGKTDVFAQADGLSGDFTTALFEDREGSIWVATLDGLDRFRDFAIPTISAKQGLSNANAWSVLAARDGSVWMGTPDGLNQWNDGKITVYRKRAKPGQKAYPTLPDDYVESLFQDDRGRIWVSTRRGAAYLENGQFVPVSAVPDGVHSIAGGSAGDIWMSQEQSLFHLRRGIVAERIPWASLGRKDVAYASIADPVRGGIWLGFFRSGVAYFKDGQVRASYAVAEGLGEGRVSSLQLDADGTLWAATEGGLSRVKSGRVATLSRKNGLPCDTLHRVIEDEAHALWLYTACGLVRIARPELDAWAANPASTVHPTVFDITDGVRSRALPSSYSPGVARSADGKLWFLPNDGVSVIDPRHIPVNKLPPPVHIEEIIADRKSYWKNITGVASSRPRLPPLVRDLVIDYTACSFVAPEKVRFRYKLEGQDPGWKEVVNDREVQYSNLAPRHYRFRVMASNDSGLWNEAGDSLEFSIDPAYYQTAWFQAACGAAFLALISALYRYRLHQFAREFNARLEERVGERTRIARELHDTLLQSFQGLLLQFQAVRNLFPQRPQEALKTLDGAIDLASDAIREGREAIQNLRSSTVMENDLAKAVETAGKELAAQQRTASGDATAFSVEVEGPSQELHPILRDEIYRITGEALRNAFHHARARRIEVEIRYDTRELRVRVRDDGIGIDPSVLSEGRKGHYGLTGMRERAKAIGGQLEVWSEHGAGAEVDLTIPAAVAYGSHAGRRFRLFNRKGGRIHERRCVSDSSPDGGTNTSRKGI